MNQTHKLNTSAPRIVSLGRRALLGLVMMLAQNAVARVTSLVSQLVLAALLLPADFGLIGLTYTVTTIVSTLTSIGVEDVILQRTRTLYAWSGAAFWINLIMSTVGGVLVILLAPAAAAAYHAPHLFGLLAVLALSMPLGALSAVPGMIMRSRMQFGVFAAYGAIETVVQALMTVGLAWLGYGAFSFVIPIPVLSIVRAITWWSLLAVKPPLRAQRRRWKYLVRNTAASFFSRLLIALISQGDYMVLGLLASQNVVGRYYFGFRLAAQPLWVFAGNLGGVLYPTLIQLKSDPVRQGKAALNACTILSYCVMPVAMLQAAVARPLLSSFFGQKWADAIPVIQILSIGLALDAPSWIAGSLLAARGEFVAGLRLVIFQVPVFFLLVIAGALFNQGVGVAYAVGLFYAATQPVFVYQVFRRVGVSLREVTLIYVKPAVLTVAAVGSGILLSGLPGLANAPLASASVISAAAAVLYAILVRQFAPSVWSQVINHTKWRETPPGSTRSM